MTTQTLTLLALFMTESSAEWYGFDLADRSGIKTGTLYPLLARLEAAGWLESWWEAVDPREVGRPRRRLYVLTGEGAGFARREVTEQLARLTPSSPRDGPLMPRERVA